MGGFFPTLAAVTLVTLVTSLPATLGPAGSGLAALSAPMELGGPAAAANGSVLPGMPEVLAMHSRTIKIQHTLAPVSASSRSLPPAESQQRTEAASHIVALSKLPAPRGIFLQLRILRTVRHQTTSLEATPTLA
jgi:hypothetical protein